MALLRIGGFPHAHATCTCQMHMRMPCTHAHVCVHARLSHRGWPSKMLLQGLAPESVARVLGYWLGLVSARPARHRPRMHALVSSVNQQASSSRIRIHGRCYGRWYPLELCGVSALELDTVTDTRYLGRTETVCCVSDHTSASSGFTRMFSAQSSVDDATSSGCNRDVTIGRVCRSDACRG